MKDLIENEFKRLIRLEGPMRLPLLIEKVSQHFNLPSSQVKHEALVLIDRGTLLIDDNYLVKTTKITLL